MVGYCYANTVARPSVEIVVTYCGSSIATGASTWVDSYGNNIVSIKWPGRVPVTVQPSREAESPRPPDDIRKKSGMQNKPIDFKSRHTNRICCAKKCKGYQSERWR